jgi:hypothetical protein
MPCIHGLDEINCPACRILKSTAPLNGIRLKNSNFPTFNNSLTRKSDNLEKKLIDEITLQKSSTYPPNLISKPHFINKPPNFKNELFLKRSKELDITNDDNYGITKKIPLESPEWKFEEED